jgi:hypothetical protein
MYSVAVTGDGHFGTHTDRLMSFRPYAATT